MVNVSEDVTCSSPTSIREVSGASGYGTSRQLAQCSNMSGVGGRPEVARQRSKRRMAQRRWQQRALVAGAILSPLDG